MIVKKLKSTLDYFTYFFGYMDKTYDFSLQKVYKTLSLLMVCTSAFSDFMMRILSLE